MQDVMLQKLTERKMEAEKSFRTGKKVVQSRDQAHMILILVPLCNSNESFYHYLITVLQQHHVVVHVV